MDQKYIDCSCHSLEHLIRISWDDEYEDLFLEYHLSMYPWYLRLWKALKYVFGFRSRYGDFGEVLFNQEQVANLVDTLLAFQNKELKQK